MTSFVFRIGQPQRQGSHSNPLVRDVESHLSASQYNYYRGDTDTTTIHECTHGINANLRNAAMIEEACLDEEQREALQQQSANYLVPFALGPYIASHSLPIPSPLQQALDSLAQPLNAFYCMDSRYVLFPEPACRKSHAVPYIPDSQKHGIYDTYVSGQEAWDDRPLYLFDEWSGYCNGALTGAEYSITYAIQFGYFTWGILRAVIARDPNYAYYDALLAYFEWTVLSLQEIQEKHAPNQSPAFHALVQHVGL